MIGGPASNTLLAIQLRSVFLLKTSACAVLNHFEVLKYHAVGHTITRVFPSSKKCLCISEVLEILREHTVGRTFIDTKNLKYLKVISIYGYYKTNCANVFFLKTSTSSEVS